jgi:hypothetical protein
MTLACDVDADTHKRFRIAVAKSGVKISDVVRPLVMAALEKMERDLARAESAKRKD